MGKPKPLDINTYFELENAYNEAVEHTEGALGGRHAILIMVLKQLGADARSWQQAENKAAEILARGYA